MEELEPELPKINARYIGNINVCLAFARVDVFPLNGCEGYAFQSLPGEWNFLIDGYGYVKSLDDDGNVIRDPRGEIVWLPDPDYTYRVPRKHLWIKGEDE
jgi:hypothetical protein